MKPIITTHDFRCDLNSGTTEASLRRALMHQDAMADCFRVAVVRDMNPVDLSGMQVTGFLQLASTGQTLPLTGDVSGHYASVTLSSACYAIPGKASLTIQLRKDDTRRSLLKVDFTIRQTGTEAVVDPEDIVPSLSELLAEISDMRQATKDANEAANSVSELAAQVEDELYQGFTLDYLPGACIADNGAVLYSADTAGWNCCALDVSSIAGQTLSVATYTERSKPIIFADAAGSIIATVVPDSDDPDSRWAVDVTVPAGADWLYINHCADAPGDVEVGGYRAVRYAEADRIPKVVQVCGDSDVTVMSQKAVTAAVAAAQEQAVQTMEDRSSPPLILQSSGELAAVTDAADRPAVSAVTLLPYASGGYSALQLFHTGRNMQPFTSDDVREISYENVNGESKTAYGYELPLPSGTYTAKAAFKAGSGSATYIYCFIMDASRAVVSGSSAQLVTGSNAKSAEITIGDGERLVIYNGVTSHGLSTTKSKFSAVNLGIYPPGVDATYEETPCAVLAVGFPETVYGGRYDWTTGVLTSTHASSGSLLDTPVTFQLAPQPLDMLPGCNHLWSDHGATEARYIADLGLYLQEAGQGSMNVVQESGDSTTAVMSQKAVTDLVNLSSYAAQTVAANAQKTAQRVSSDMYEPYEPDYLPGAYIISGSSALHDAAQTAWQCVAIDVSASSGEQYTVVTHADNAHPIIFADASGTVVSSLTPGKTSPARWEQTVTVPSGAAWLHISRYASAAEDLSVSGCSVVRFAWKSDIPQVVQESGDSESAVMSQKAVTSLLSAHGVAAVATAVVPQNNRIPVAGEDVPIYLENLFRGLSPKEAKLVATPSAYTHIYEKEIALLRTGYGTGSSPIRLYLNDDSSITASATLPYAAAAAKTGSRKALFIGDSITENLSYLTPLKELGDDAGYAITFLGTQGTTTYRHEGRSGWAAYNYATNDLTGLSTSRTNPFWDGSAFSFSHYMENSGIDAPDFIFINLGTNDMVRGVSDTADEAEIKAVITASYQTMIDAIRAYSTTVPIILWLPPTRSLAGRNNRLAIDSCLRANQWLIEEFDQVSCMANRIYLMPTHLFVNPRTDYTIVKTTIDDVEYDDNTEPIHPTADGGRKIAKGILRQMMYIDGLLGR